MPGLSSSIAVKVEAAVDRHNEEYGELSRESHLDRLAQYEGVGAATVRKLKEKRARNKLKFYQMEYVDD